MSAVIPRGVLEHDAVSVDVLERPPVVVPIRIPRRHLAKARRDEPCTATLPVVALRDVERQKVIASGCLPNTMSKPSGFSYGWVVVGAGAMMTCIGFGAMLSLAVFLQPISDAMGWSRSGVSAAATIDFLCMNALVSLGYSEREAAAAVKQLPDGVAVADGIKQALKLLAKA